MIGIGIFGMHPALNIGFNAAMSMNWCIGLCRVGCKVTLYVREDAMSVDPRALDRWGCDFEIRSLRVGDSLAGHDVLVWQSYHRKDHKEYWEIFKSSPGIKVKSFHRFMTGNLETDKHALSGSMAAFDIVAFALESEYKIAKLVLGEANGIAYVPRGFAVDFLYPRKGDRFCVSVDVRKPDRPMATDYEPSRVYRRLVSLSQAAIADPSSCS